MSNIIETILKSSPNKKKMPAEDFFTENNPNGYCSKPGFVHLTSLLSETNLKKTELIFEYQSEGYQNDNPAITYLDDETGLNLVWTKWMLGGSTQNIPFYVTERMAVFIKDCQKRKVRPAFTFEELYKAAIGTESEQR